MALVFTTGKDLPCRQFTAHRKKWTCCGKSNGCRAKTHWPKSEAKKHVKGTLKHCETDDLSLHTFFTLHSKEQHILLKIFGTSSKHSQCDLWLYPNLMVTGSPAR